MCGLAGFVDRSRGTGREALERAARAMAGRLRHRGPDDDGVWVDEAAGVALGHRRLAIIDVSPAGHQPMISADGRYVIVYNGEVYNYLDLADELNARGRSFSGASDTEVLLEGCCEWGPREMVSRLVGMFAFALWDRRENELTLVRDRLGIKPLYWGEAGDLLLFASELKALRAHEGWAPEIERGALPSYLRQGFIPAPLSIYKGIFKLEPGHMVTWRPGQEPQISCYWNLHDVACGRHAEALSPSDGEAVEAMETLLRDAVKGHMVSDVPLGAFLSGGIDSSLVVSLMQAQSTRPVKTFTIGFREQDFDEAKFAKAVAAHVGADHTELYLGPKDARDLIPELPEWYDEPFADSSQLPTALVSRLAREQVTVSLSGDGGDEVFAGYERYLTTKRTWATLSRVPAPMRRAGARVIAGLPPGLARAMGRLLPGELGRHLAMGRLPRLVEVLRLATDEGLYRSAMSHWQDPEAIVKGAAEHRGRLWDDDARAEIPDFIRRMQYSDAAAYLPDDILTKVDRASMAFSLEARVPFLDHRVIELAWRLPSSMMMRDGKGKWLTRQILGKYVPRHLFERPKMGFGVPIHEWLRGPLREWAEDLLAPARLEDEGFFDPVPIRARWREHLSGDADWAYPLWNVLIFQAWYRQAAVPPAS